MSVDLWDDPHFSGRVFLVGGAVRDKLMGKTPNDRDWVIVGATDDDVQLLMSRGYEQVGADFPVFLHPTTKEEYALARKERKVGAGYHGFEVQTKDVSLKDDLSRRDLTINAMAMTRDGKIIDPFKGAEDLEYHILRHTTDAFSEDPLRIMRVARFAARWNFSVHVDTTMLCRAISQSINELSIERIWAELEKGFQTDNISWYRTQLISVTIGAHELINEVIGFSDTNSEKMTLCRALRDVPLEARLAVSVAVLADPEAKLVGASVRVRNAHKNACKLRASRRTGAEIFDVLQSAKALQGGEAFNDLLLCANVLNAAISSSDLQSAKEKALQITAANFPALDGKELGAAIKQARIDAIQTFL